MSDDALLSEFVSAPCAAPHAEEEEKKKKTSGSDRRLTVPGSDAPPFLSVSFAALLLTPPHVCSTSPLCPHPRNRNRNPLGRRYRRRLDFLPLSGPS